MPMVEALTNAGAISTAKPMSAIATKIKAADANASRLVAANFYSIYEFLVAILGIASISV